MSLSEATARDRLNLFKLEDASQFPRWQQQLQEYLFKKIRNVNMDKLKDSKTLDATYFSKHPGFKDDFKELKKNGDPLDNADFCAKCKAHAVREGEGFNDWVYLVFPDIRNALSEDIREQTGGVSLGDLTGLLEEIKLSIHQSETANKHALELEYGKCTMAVEGKNDLMTFLAVLSRYHRRLEAAGIQVEDGKKQEVLKEGLDQAIFETIISNCDRQPYASYAKLAAAVKKHARKHLIREKLMALKPGNPHSALTTRSAPDHQPKHQPAHQPNHQPADNSQRLDRIEAILVSLTNTKAAQLKKQKCFKFEKGTCDKGDKCPYDHGSSNNSSNNSNNGNKQRKYCILHRSTTHDTSECNKIRNDPGLMEAYAKLVERAEPGQRVNKATTGGDDGYSFLFPTRAALPQHIFAMRGLPKIDLWCVDGAATTSATYDRGKCFNIRPCKVTIHGPDSDSSFTCVEKGDVIINVDDKSTGKLNKLLVTDVLINEAFPFHIFSEIIAYEKHCSAVKSLGSWQFLNPSAQPLFHASQRLLNGGSSHSDMKLYFIDEASPDTKGDTTTINAAVHETKTARADAGLPADHRPCHPAFDRTARALANYEAFHGLEAGTATIEQVSSPSAGVHGWANTNLTSVDAAQRPARTTAINTAKKPAKSTTRGTAKISTARNLQMLLELHCAHDHWNFEDVASHYGLTLPSPRPECWACLLSKPKLITHDKVSTRRTTRVFEGFAADAKGPMTTPTPEGYKYFFLILCLLSSYCWVKLAKSQAEWKDIWPAHVKRCEAKTGKDRCVSFIITDGHKVHSGGDVMAFNKDRGIEPITCAPYSQWQDPAERYIQTISGGARTSLIHGGGKEWMWGWATEHAADSRNRTPPPRPVPGHEGKTRLRIAFPAVTEEKELRTLKPFLCLCFKTVPKAKRGANFNPRANPCVNLRYVPERKAYALLTIPNLYLVWSIEVRFVPGCFPLRVTDHLMNQIDTFLRPTVEDTMYASVHGPGNIMRRRRLASPAAEPNSLVASTPVEVLQPNGTRQPIDINNLPGPGWSSTRGYRPSAAGLESAAFVAAIPTARVQDTSLSSAPSSSHRRAYTPDQLAARTPRCVQHALKGPDAKYWLPAILKDFAIIRDNQCIINITDKPPPGPAPPAVEQRFKIKYRGDRPIALEDIPPEDWKARTITRGDRFRHGEHYDATAAPVVHTPTLKMLLAWAVAKNLLLFQWDQSAAFYGNGMDRPGVIVRLPPGYDPHSDSLRPLHLPPLYGELGAALPGIPQGSLLHYKELSPAIKEQGFEPVDADNCLFLHRTIDMATSLHVDDGVLAAPSHEHAERVLGSSGLGGKKKITWGPLESTLGIDFKVDYTGDRRLVFMSQRAYAITILERASMLDCNPARTPASPGRKYTKTDCPATDQQRGELRSAGFTKESYHSIVAALNFLVSITRDDMRFIQGKLSKYCQNPGVEHARALKHALRFLKGTLDYGIEFAWRASDPAPKDGPLDIVAWSDSSFADDVDTGRSTLGSCIQINGATVSASSKLSPRVDSCVNHSELRSFAEVTGGPGSGDELTDGASVALLKTSRTVKWVRGIKAALERRSVANMPPTPVLVDNAGVISMLEDCTLKAANRHIYRALAENREHVQLDKTVAAVKISTKDNLANALTKQEHGIAESAAQLRLITGPPSV